MGQERSAAVLDAIDRMSPAEQERIFSMFEHYLKQWRKLKGHHGPSVAHALHAQLDRRMIVLHEENSKASEIKCRPGCAACCKQLVEITEQEAQLIALYVVDKGIPIDTELMARQADKSEIEEFKGLPPEDKRCVFLTADNLCAIYEHRPGVCRKYFVISDPALCDVETNFDGEVATLVDFEAEVIHSAAFQGTRRGNLPRMLGRALAKLPSRRVRGR